MGYSFLMGAQGEKWTNWTGLNKLRAAHVCVCVFSTKVVDDESMQVYMDGGDDERCV